LAELDKQEMENEYERFTLQYGEMITQINNDSIVAQLTQEQLRTQQLLEELKRVKANDAREITRLKKELAAVREVLRSYIRQVDSLNQINASLRSENSQIRSELAQTNREKEGLQNEKQTLTEKVAIAAQLDATGITLTAMKGDKPTRKNKLKKANKLKVTYTISKNVTASNGQRTIYTSIRKPNGDVLAGGGSFSYENKQLKASAKNTIEYTGEQITVTAYWTGSEVLSGGDYLVSIFADGHLIGSGRFNMVE
jgi:chromosome segregation ATPase